MLSGWSQVFFPGRQEIICQRYSTSSLLETPTAICARSQEGANLWGPRAVGTGSALQQPSVRPGDSSVQDSRGSRAGSPCVVLVICSWAWLVPETQRLPWRWGQLARRGSGRRRWGYYAPKWGSDIPTGGWAELTPELGQGLAWQSAAWLGPDGARAHLLWGCRWSGSFSQERSLALCSVPGYMEPAILPEWLY